ncbi:MAG: hypothetical protein II863_03050 [Kiritimatiellae bacterium]|nr:hypothetical protein [Kiritimatiellia bacterium]
MRKLMLCIAATLLATLLTACQSDKVVYVDKPVVPELVFPVFPILAEGDAVRDREAGTVTVPEAWIVRLEEYHIRIKETEKNYCGLKALYEE